MRLKSQTQLTHNKLIWANMPHMWGWPPPSSTHRAGHLHCTRDSGHKKPQSLWWFYGMFGHRNLREKKRKQFLCNAAKILLSSNLKTKVFEETSILENSSFLLKFLPLICKIERLELLPNFINFNPTLWWKRPNNNWSKKIWDATK